MSRFYSFEWEGLSGAVKPRGHRYMLFIRRAPYLTGHPAVFRLSLRGQHNAVTHITPELERPDDPPERLQPQPANSMDFAFQRLDVSGQYRLFLRFESIQTGRGFVTHYRLLAATLQVIEDYRPIFMIMNLTIGAIIGVAVGVVITLFV